MMTHVDDKHRTRTDPRTSIAENLDRTLSEFKDEFGLSAEAVRILQAVVVSLDEQPSVREIAQQASVSDKTVYKWTSDPRFIRAQQKICGSLIGLNLASLTNKAITKAHKGSEVLLTKILTTGGIFAEEGLNVHVEVNTSEIDRLSKSLESKIADLRRTIDVDVTELPCIDITDDDGENEVD